MALKVTAPLLGRRVEPPFRLSPAADRSNAWVEVDQPRRRRVRWCGCNKTVDIVLRVRRLPVTVDVVMARLTEGLRVACFIEQMKPVKVTLTLRVGATVTALVIEVCPSAAAELFRHHQFDRIVAAKA